MVRRVRRVYHTRSVGHTGTLDPFATGLLVVLVGSGTRLARFVERQDKIYLAEARLGVTTDTEDLTGEVVARKELSPEVTAEVVAAELAGLVGRQLQTPPSYSAKKVSGVPSHRLARRGAAVALEPVEITVRRLDLLGFQGDRVTFRAEVSAGTYIRSLARDLGERLGLGAHLTALRREAIGALRVEQAVPLELLAPEVPLRPLLDVVGHLPAVELTEEQLEMVSHGRAVAGTAPSGAEVILTAGGEVVAVAQEQQGDLQPRVVLAG